MNKLSTLSGVLLVLVAAITATLVGCKRQEASTQVSLPQHRRRFRLAPRLTMP